MVFWTHIDCNTTNYVNSWNQFVPLQDIVRFRSDLKLIVSSATLDAEKFSVFFDHASIFMIPVCDISRCWS